MYWLLAIAMTICVLLVVVPKSIQAVVEFLLTIAMTHCVLSVVVPIAHRAEVGYLMLPCI